MSNINRISNSVLPDRLYGEHYPDSFLDMPGPIWSAGMGCMDNIDKHMRQEHIQPNKPYIASQPSESNFYSDCSGSHHAKCGDTSDDSVSSRCAGSSVSATGDEGRVSPNHLGNIRCPENGKLCHTSVCRDECGEWIEKRVKSREERRERNK